MKKILLIATVLLLAASASPQTESDPSLRLTTSIVAQKYCASAGYTDMAMLRLSLRLTYTNVGAKPLIVYRGAGLMHYVLVSANEEAARNRQYETDMHVGWVTSGPELNEGSKPGNEFVVLRPGANFIIDDVDESIPIDLNSTTEFLKPGQHVLQGVIETWPGDEKQFERLSKKWASVGLLWSRNVRSEPMPFSVDKNPKLMECK